MSRPDAEKIIGVFSKEENGLCSKVLIEGGETTVGCAVGALLIAAGMKKEAVAVASDDLDLDTAGDREALSLLQREYNLSTDDVSRLMTTNDCMEIPVHLWYEGPLEIDRYRRDRMMEWVRDTWGNNDDTEEE